MKKIKTRLKDLRVEHGLSQYQISQVLGISQVTYSYYELNRREVPLPIVIELAKYYKTSVDYILYLTDDPNPKEDSANL